MARIKGDGNFVETAFFTDHVEQAGVAAPYP